MIKRLLVANRGEIARRIFASCRAVGIETVAVHSDADADAPHVAEADYAVRLPGSAAAATYLRGDLMVAAAQRCGADAIHPGYGFLAEDAEFAREVIDAGLVWVGPPSKTIEMLCDKLEAKTLVGHAGVPVLASYLEPDQVSTFPVLVKSSGAGSAANRTVGVSRSAGRAGPNGTADGGRSMRVVRDAESLAEAVASARREAGAAFGDGTVFCEPYIERARHIEVQVLADTHGNVITLGERECSIQRRYQKIIEETPSAVVTPALREELCSAAIAAAQAVSYVGAGTVEFLLAPDGEFHFLEMNPRLQVEHPVTECVVGVDLVRLQLLIAEGGSLPFNGPPPLRGHAIEARLYAEDPASDWAPSSGTLHRFAVPGVAQEFGPLLMPGLRLDSGVADGSVVGVHYDPMLAKVIAWGPSRHEAARMLAGALARAQIHGLVTNRDLLVRILRHPSFLAGTIDTGFLDRHPELYAPLLSSVDAMRLSCLAATLAGAAARRAAAPLLASLPSGWRNVASVRRTVAYDAPTGTLEVGYSLDRSDALAAWSVRTVDREDVGLPGNSMDPVPLDDHPLVRVVSVTGDRVVLDVAGARMTYSVHRVGAVSHVDSAEGSVALTEVPRFPRPFLERPEGSLIAPLPGAVSRVLVVPGQRVVAGDLLLTVEAMKLEHPVHAPAAGVISDLWVKPGTQVVTGTLLAVLTAD